MDFKASYRKLESVHTVTCPGGPRGTPHFPQLKSVLPNSSAIHDFASSGTDHIRVPSPLHTTGEKTTTTSPALSSSSERAAEPHLETAGRQQLTGNQTQKKKYRVYQGELGG